MTRRMLGMLRNAVRLRTSPARETETPHTQKKPMIPTKADKTLRLR
jgi:hypothetical protein